MKVSTTISANAKKNAGILFGLNSRVVIKRLYRAAHEPLLNTEQLSYVIRFLADSDSEEVEAYANTKAGKTLAAHLRKFLSAKTYKVSLDNLAKAKLPKKMRDALEKSDTVSDNANLSEDIEDDYGSRQIASLRTLPGLVYGYSLDKKEVRYVYPDPQRKPTAHDISIVAKYDGKRWAITKPDSKISAIDLYDAVNAAIEDLRPESGLYVPQPTPRNPNAADPVAEVQGGTGTAIPIRTQHYPMEAKLKFRVQGIAVRQGADPSVRGASPQNEQVIIDVVTRDGRSLKQIAKSFPVTAILVGHDEVNDGFTIVAAAHRADFVLDYAANVLTGFPCYFSAKRQMGASFKGSYAESLAEDVEDNPGYSIETVIDMNKPHIFLNNTAKTVGLANF